MATIKSYTDLSQSKTLSKILPYESADMVIWGSDLASVAATDAQKFMRGLKERKMNYLPCWSLAALLSVLPEGIRYYAPNLQKEDGKYSIAYGDDELLCIADNPVDACYKFILTLHEEKML